MSCSTIKSTCNSYLSYVYMLCLMTVAWHWLVSFSLWFVLLMIYVSRAAPVLDWFFLISEGHTIESATCVLVFSLMH